jgi:hypothetical protein
LEFKEIIYKFGFTNLFITTIQGNCMKKPLFRSALVLLFAIASCQDPLSDSTGEDPNNKGKWKREITYTSDIDRPEVENLLNPYNEYGRLHNRGVYFIYGELNSNLSTASDFDIHNSLINFYESEFPNLTLNQDTSTLFNSFMSSYDYDHTTTSSLSQNQKYDTLGLSLIQRAYLEEIYETFRDSTLSYSQVITELNTIEDNVLDGVNISDSLDKRILLFTLSIAKHSFAYWYHYLPEATTSIQPFKENRIQDMSEKEKEKKAKKIAEADALGAFNGIIEGGFWGGLTGAAVGAGAGGIGAGPGALIGGVLGGLGSGLSGAINSSTRESITERVPCKHCGQ